jgi:hypothetical protein
MTHSCIREHHSWLGYWNCPEKYVGTVRVVERSLIHIDEFNLLHV